MANEEVPYVEITLPNETTPVVRLSLEEYTSILVAMTSRMIHEHRCRTIDEFKHVLATDARYTRMEKRPRDDITAIAEKILEMSRLLTALLIAAESACEKSKNTENQ